MEMECLVFASPSAFSGAREEVRETEGLGKTSRGTRSQKNPPKNQLFFPSHLAGAPLNAIAMFWSEISCKAGMKLM